VSGLATARRMVSTAARTFGWKTAATTTLGLAAIGVARASMTLDPVFVRGLRDVRVEKPLFILGAARSGTTLLHRLFAQNGDYCVFRAWELAVPSLVHRRLLAPVVRRARPGERYFDLFPDDSHEITWDSIEEEELLLLGRLDTQMLLALSPLAFAEEDPPGFAIFDEAPDARRSADHLKRCIERQIVATGRDRVVAKMPYSTTRVRTLAATFPDARFVYLVRSPLETVPSHLSMMRGIFERLYGLDRIPAEALARFYDRRYRLNVAAYRYFEDVLASGDLAGRVLVVPYPELDRDAAGCFERVAAFADLPVSAELRKAVAAAAVRQRARVRPHVVQPLEPFGVPRERVLADLGFMLDRYGFPRG
jgi:hypothetical protein